MRKRIKERKKEKKNPKWVTFGGLVLQIFKEDIHPILNMVLKILGEIDIIEGEEDASNQHHALEAVNQLINILHLANKLVDLLGNLQQGFLEGLQNGLQLDQGLVCFELVAVALGDGVGDLEDVNDVFQRLRAFDNGGEKAFPVEWEVI